MVTKIRIGENFLIMSRFVSTVNMFLTTIIRLIAHWTQEKLVSIALSTIFFIVSCFEKGDRLGFCEERYAVSMSYIAFKMTSV